MPEVPRAAIGGCPLNAWVQHLERVAEDRYGRGSSVEVDVEQAQIVIVKILNPGGGIVTSARASSRTSAVLTLLRAHGEPVAF